MARPSTVERLPDDVRAQLQELLRNKRVSQLDATARINAILEEEGHPERLSKSAVNRYAVRMEEVGRRLRESRQIAEMWIGKVGAQPAGQVGHLLNEIVRNLVFETSMNLAEGEQPAEPKVLKDLAKAIELLEKASSDNVKREQEIRKQAAVEAAAAAESAVRSAGLSEESVEKIKRSILGIAA